jgi:hypothetical protein
VVHRLAGFGVRVYPSGKKVFVAQVRVGRFQRRVTIGAYDPYTVEKARKRAENIIRAASEGRDPREKREARNALNQGDRPASRQARTPHRASPADAFAGAYGGAS